LVDNEKKCEVKYEDGFLKVASTTADYY